MASVADSFAGEVRQALENIPHTRQCYSTRLGDLGEVEAKVCICDREARIAAAVARAIEIAAEDTLYESRPQIDRAIRALGEAPRP